MSPASSTSTTLWAAKTSTPDGLADAKAASHTYGRNAGARALIARGWAERRERRGARHSRRLHSLLTVRLRRLDRAWGLCARPLHLPHGGFLRLPGLRASDEGRRPDQRGFGDRWRKHGRVFGLGHAEPRSLGNDA